MRKSVLVLLALLLAVSASAQTLDKPTRISFFISNLAFGWSEGNGSAIDAGVGVALERRFSRAWSAELAVATETHETQPYGFFNPARFDLRTYPIDAVVRYSFLDVHTQWRPYVGAGARYVTAPDEPPNIEYDNQLTPQIAAGVEFNGSESWSLQFGAKQLIHEQSSVFDESFKLSIGVGWRF
ncbi:MAG TPA: OmpW family outer membrane protein [Thermoanaerobaculia bacterium]|jgi:outer membrane protein W|nr:OmpW family outer membrane protein [Thermoanaerobaculia bacterium]